MKKILKIALVVALSLSVMVGLVACGSPNSSPEALAKAQFNLQKKGTANLKADDVLKLMWFEDDNAKAITKGFLEMGIAAAKATPESDEEKAMRTSMKWLGYEKVSGTDDTEVGKIKFSAKVDGEVVEEEIPFTAVKKDGKWYMVS